MNTLIKRSMKLGLAVLFIGAVIVPACAQKVIKPIKPKAPKKPPMTGMTGATVRVPRKPITPKTTPAVAASVARSTAIASSKALKNPSKTQGMWVKVMPNGIASPTDAQLRDNVLVPSKKLVPVESITPAQLTNAVYLWAQENPNTLLESDSILEQKITEVLSQKTTPTLSSAPLLPFLRTVQRNNGNIHSFTKLAAKYEEYPHNVKLDKFGFPKKGTADATLDAYLLVADPVEMGAFIREISPNLLETPEIAQTGLVLGEADRVAAEMLIDRRLERLSKVNAEDASPRDVLQIAYDYFITQQILSKGDLREMDFAYCYRTDLPFEQLTTAEKEGFIVHKLIRSQIGRDPFTERPANSEQAMLDALDLAHLELLDYVASQNAYKPFFSVNEGYYNTLGGLEHMVNVYNNINAGPAPITILSSQQQIIKRAGVLLEEDIHNKGMENKLFLK